MFLRVPPCPAMQNKVENGILLCSPVDNEDVDNKDVVFLTRKCSVSAFRSIPNCQPRGATPLTKKRGGLWRETMSESSPTQKHDFILKKLEIC